MTSSTATLPLVLTPVPPDPPAVACQTEISVRPVGLASSTPGAVAVRLLRQAAAAVGGPSAVLHGDDLRLATTLCGPRQGDLRLLPVDEVDRLYIRSMCQLVDALRGSYRFRFYDVDRYDPASTALFRTLYSLYAPHVFEVASTTSPPPDASTLPAALQRFLGTAASMGGSFLAHEVAEVLGLGMGWREEVLRGAAHAFLCRTAREDEWEFVSAAAFDQAQQYSGVVDVHRLNDVVLMRRSPDEVADAAFLAERLCHTTAEAFAPELALQCIVRLLEAGQHDAVAWHAMRLLQTPAAAGLQATLAQYLLHAQRAGGGRFLDDSAVLRAATALAANQTSAAVQVLAHQMVLVPTALSSSSLSPRLEQLLDDGDVQEPAQLMGLFALARRDRWLGQLHSAQMNLDNIVRRLPRSGLRRSLQGMILDDVVELHMGIGQVQRCAALLRDVAPAHSVVDNAHADVLRGFVEQASHGDVGAAKRIARQLLTPPSPSHGGWQ